MFRSESNLCVLVFMNRNICSHQCVCACVCVLMQVKNIDVLLTWNVRRIHSYSTSRQKYASLENAILIFGQSIVARNIPDNEACAPGRKSV